MSAFCLIKKNRKVVDCSQDFKDICLERFDVVVEPGTELKEFLDDKQLRTQVMKRNSTKYIKFKGLILMSHGFQEFALLTFLNDVEKKISKISADIKDDLSVVTARIQLFQLNTDNEELNTAVEAIKELSACLDKTLNTENLFTKSE